MDATESKEEGQGEELKPKNKGGRPRKSRRAPRKRVPPKIKDPLRHAVRSRSSRKAWETRFARNPELRKQMREQCKRMTEIRKKKGPPRLGVPDGWTRIKADIQRVYDGCRADLLMDRMRELGMVEPISPGDYERVTVKLNGEDVEVLVPVTDEGKAQAALREAMIGAISPLTHSTARPAYIRTVLEWTKAKPAQKTDLKVSTSEDWLEAALKDCTEPYDADDTGATEAP